MLAVLGPPPEDAARAAALAIPGLELITTGLPLDWLAETPEEVLEAGAALSKLAREQGCGLVQIHAPALAAGRAFGVPVISVHHAWHFAQRPRCALAMASSSVVDS